MIRAPSRSRIPPFCAMAQGRSDMLSLAHEPDAACAEGSQTSYMCGRCRVRLVILTLLALRRGARAGCAGISAGQSLMVEFLQVNTDAALVPPADEEHAGRLRVPWRADRGNMLIRVPPAGVGVACGRRLRVPGPSLSPGGDRHAYQRRPRPCLPPLWLPGHSPSPNRCPLSTPAHRQQARGLDLGRRCARPRPAPDDGAPGWFHQSGLSRDRAAAVP